MIAIDTNVLVHAFDHSNSKKHEFARDILLDIFNGKKQGVVTNQILAEMSMVLLRKVKHPLDRASVKAICGSIVFSNNWKVYDYNGQTLLKALEMDGPFWDALIVQTLRENGIQKIYTENVKDFKDSGVQAINPFQHHA